MSTALAFSEQPLEESICSDEATDKLLYALQGRLGRAFPSMVLDDMTQTMQAVMPRAEKTDDFYFEGPCTFERISLEDVFRASAVPASGVLRPVDLSPLQKEGVRVIGDFLKKRRILNDDSTLSDAFRCTIKVGGYILDKLYATAGLTLCARDAQGGVEPVLRVATRCDDPF